MNKSQRILVTTTRAVSVSAAAHDHWIQPSSCWVLAGPLGSVGNDGSRSLATGAPGVVRCSRHDALVNRPRHRNGYSAVPGLRDFRRTGYDAALTNSVASGRR
ncbi:MAG: hypothetical protein AAGH76_12230 [Pseudomonadota bacterium]